MANATIPDSHRDLLEKPLYAVVTTVMPDGQPQSTVVWIDIDGNDVLFNTARGRQKDKNLQDNNRVTVMVVDPDNGFRWLEVRGTAEDTEEGAVEHINKLSRKYTGRDYYGDFNQWSTPETETRVIYRITPHKVTANG